MRNPFHSHEAELQGAWRASEDDENERRQSKRGLGACDSEQCIPSGCAEECAKIESVQRARALFACLGGPTLCREVAPTPGGLKQIEGYLRSRNEQAIADLVCFLAYSGLRIGEALSMTWGAVNWGEQILHVSGRSAE